MPGHSRLGTSALLEREEEKALVKEDIFNAFLAMPCIMECKICTSLCLKDHNSACIRVLLKVDGWDITSEAGNKVKSSPAAQLSLAAVAMHMAPSWAPAPCWIQEIVITGCFLVTRFLDTLSRKQTSILIWFSKKSRMSEENVLPCISPLLLKLIKQENDDDLYLVAEIRPQK